MKKFFVLLFGLIILIVMGGCQSLVDFFPFLNRAPIIISEPAITATENNQYSYQLEAKDPDGDNLTYFLVLCPDGMSINSENGLLTWIPTNNQVGIHLITVETSDGKQSDTQSFEIEVINVNDPPLIFSYSPINLNFKINEGSSVKFEIQAQDIDLNATLSYQWLLNGKKVSSSSVSGNDSKSSWIYYTSYGDYNQKIVKVLVSDGELEGQDYIQWNLTINDITPPAQPTLNTVISPTNISSQTLSGTKESNTSIWINGVEVVPIDSYVDWSYSFNLSEGENNISITSQDSAGNESGEATVKIILDTISPIVPTLNKVITPTNISVQILYGSKEANSSIWLNGTEIITANSSTNWNYAYNLTEGLNNISITSRDALGNESTAVTTTIEYDPNIYVDAANTTGIEDGTQTHPFDTITEGIIAVPSGKSVVVSAGTYNEQLIINKSITLHGASQANTFITGSGLTENLISLEADNITITGFTIDGTNSIAKGIYFDNCASININNNIIQNNTSYGINYTNSNPIIEYNDIKDNDYSGIDVAAGGAGAIRDNSLINNLYGIRSCVDSSPEITGNNINNNNTGIYCRESATPTISIHGINNETNHNIYAKNNWWGDAAGPKYPYHTSSSGDWAYWSGTGSEIIFTPHLITEP